MTSIPRAISVIAMLLLVSLLASGPTAAQGRPQEVLDLVAAHQALAMKIRPLHDRVLVARSKPKESGTAFKPDGTPLRAKAGTGTGTASESGRRVSERLRHKGRAATSGDDYGRIKVKMAALDKKAKAERERVNRPKFGAGGRGVAAARKKLASLQRELAALEREMATLQGSGVPRKKPGRTK